MNEKNRPRIGLAFSGASSRSVFYIGFLEILREYKVPIDYIAATSGSAIVAAAYACGSLEQLKQRALHMNKEFLYSMVENSRGKGGIYNMRKVEEELRVYTRNQTFEDVKPLMGFVVTDLSRGEELVLSMGDIAKAACATCTLPGIFQPMQWGNRMLVDGGIVNTVPGNVVQQAGMDVVIGIHLDTTPQIFSGWHILVRRLYNAFRRIFFVDQASRLWQRLGTLVEDSNYFYYSPLVNQLEARSDYSSMFSVLGRSIDLAISARKHHDPNSNFGCDLVIRPKIPNISKWRRNLFLYFTDFSHSNTFYELGREAALDNLPKIWQMIADFEVQQAEATQVVKTMMEDHE
jgi:NTE family protein